MRDRWAQWLLDRRFGGSEDQQRRVMTYLRPIRDRVLDGAAPQPGETVLDVGCGDGLLGFAVLDRTAPIGRVIFSDVSTQLLDQCRELADATGVTDRCEFVHAALPHLDGLDDACADVVVLRSVLIYVEDKQTAFLHLRRVLRPGGRLSLFEPINAFGYPEPTGWLWGFDVSGLEPLAERVQAAYREHHGDPCPMLGFDERDLLAWAEGAGFQDLRLDYEAQVGSRHPAADMDLSTFLRSAPNPLVPSFGQLLTEALEPADRQLLTRRHGAARRRPRPVAASGELPDCPYLVATPAAPRENAARPVCRRPGRTHVRVRVTSSTALHGNPVGPQLRRFVPGVVGGSA